MSYLVKISSDHYNNFDAARKSDFEIAINQIALKEGWDYETSYRDALTLKGKYFIDFFGEEWRNKEYCTYKEVAQALNEETERREVWRKRCPVVMKLMCTLCSARTRKITINVLK